MVPIGIELPSQTRDASGHVLTHGYVHGHVHQHRDHVHIHGHIHNHDHVEHSHDNHASVDGLCEAPVGSNSGIPGTQAELSELECKELENSFIMCNDIFCDELDDCYFYDCDDKTQPEGGSTNNLCGVGQCTEFDGDTGTCCEDEACLEEPAANVCADSICVKNEHHDNSLCELQKPRLTIFEDLIQNVHRNIEQYGAAANTEASEKLTSTPSVNQTVNASDVLSGNSQFHIHFPHHCHMDHMQPGAQTDAETAHPLTQENPVLPNVNTHSMAAGPDTVLGSGMGQGLNEHTLHQSCFHARLPAAAGSNIKSPFMGGGPVGEQASKPMAQDMNVGDMGNLHQQNDYDFFVQFNNFRQIFADQPTKVAEIKEPSVPYVPLTNAPIHQPHTFSCQWENCLQSVDNESLLTHLLGSHLRHDTQGTGQEDAARPMKLECEWDDCGFVDGNLQAFLDHLNTHKTEETQTRIKHETSPLLTPSSMEAVYESPQGPASTEMRSNPNVGSWNAKPLNYEKYENYEKRKKDDCCSACVKNEVPQQHSHGLSISEIRITRKKHTASAPFDPSHTCKWQVGTAANGEAILCNETHASDGDLQEHLKEEHIGRGKSIYHCCWHGCERNHGKPFAQRQKLFRHIHIHTGHKPCVCDVCGAQFAVDSMLKQHQRTHSGERPYECATCGRCFATSSSLAIHMRVHTDSRPLMCTWPGCGKRFRESSNLAKHMRTHSTTFTCEHCGREFDKRRSYTRHLKTHQV